MELIDTSELNYEITGSLSVAVISGQIISKVYRSLYRDLLIRKSLKKSNKNLKIHSVGTDQQGKKKFLHDGPCSYLACTSAYDLVNIAA